MIVLGHYLKDARTSKSISMKAITEKTGISDSVLSHIECGVTQVPSPFALQKLAELFNIDILEVYLKAGYLKEDDLGEKKEILIGIEKLSEEDVICVQHVINRLIDKNS